MVSAELFQAASAIHLMNELLQGSIIRGFTVEKEREQEADNKYEADDILTFAFAIQKSTQIKKKDD